MFEFFWLDEGSGHENQPYIFVNDFSIVPWVFAEQFHRRIKHRKLSRPAVRGVAIE